MYFRPVHRAEEFQVVSTRSHWASTTGEYPSQTTQSSRHPCRRRAAGDFKDRRVMSTAPPGDNTGSIVEGKCLVGVDV